MTKTRRPDSMENARAVVLLGLLVAAGCGDDSPEAADRLAAAGGSSGASSAPASGGASSGGRGGALGGSAGVGGSGSSSSAAGASGAPLGGSAGTAGAGGADPSPAGAAGTAGAGGGGSGSGGAGGCLNPTIADGNDRNAAIAACQAACSTICPSQVTCTSNCLYVAEARQCYAPLVELEQCVLEQCDGYCPAASESRPPQSPGCEAQLMELNRCAAGCQNLAIADGSDRDAAYAACQTACSVVCPRSAECLGDCLAAADPRQCYAPLVELEQCVLEQCGSFPPGYSCTDNQPPRAQACEALFVAFNQCAVGLP